jgi:hypothetical protein
MSANDKGVPEKSDIAAETLIHTSPCWLLIETPKVRYVAEMQTA